MYSVTLIGLGRMGKALARALPQAKYRVDALVVRRKKNWCDDNPDRADDKRVLELGELDAIDADIVILTTQDSEIGPAARMIKPLIRGSKFIFHTSGSLSSSVLEPLARADIHIGSIHPLVSVSGSEARPNLFENVNICVEGDSVSVEVANEIAADLGGFPFEISTSKKSLYHAAAVMASGHLVALIDAATTMIRDCVAEEIDAGRLLEPLIQSTISNIGNSGINGSLTGPFARGDVQTVEANLAAIARLDDENLTQIYSALGERACRISAENGKARESIELIRKLLSMAISNPEC